MSITTSPEIKNISAALLGFQGQIRGVGRDSTNPGFKSKYASLENVVETIRESLQAHSLVFMQSGGAIVDGTMAMTTRLIHASSGEWIEGNMDIMLGKRDPQGTGSAQTYAQRYHLMAMLGLPPVDDDGEAAIDRENKRPMSIAATGKPVQRLSAYRAKTIINIEAIQSEVHSCDTLEKIKNLRELYQGIEWMPGGWTERILELIDEKQGVLSVNPGAAMDEAYRATIGTPPPKAATPNFDHLAPNDIDPKAERLAKIGNTI